MIWHPPYFFARVFSGFGIYLLGFGGARNWSGINIYGNGARFLITEIAQENYVSELAWKYMFRKWRGNINTEIARNAIIRK